MDEKFLIGFIFGDKGSIMFGGKELLKFNLSNVFKKRNVNHRTCNFRFDARTSQIYLEFMKYNACLPLDIIVGKSNYKNVYFSDTNHCIYENKVTNANLEDNNGILDFSFDVRDSEVKRISKIYDKLANSNKDNNGVS